VKKTIKDVLLIIFVIFWVLIVLYFLLGFLLNEDIITSRRVESAIGRNVIYYFELTEVQMELGYENPLQGLRISHLIEPFEWRWTAAYFLHLAQREPKFLRSLALGQGVYPEL